MPRFAQVKENVRLDGHELPQTVYAEIDRLNAELDGEARILVRPSGTEPLIRILAEASAEQEARDLCGKVSALVRRELG
jgi:phosphoglucosamine mutase